MGYPPKGGILLRGYPPKESLVNVLGKTKLMLRRIFYMIFGRFIFFQSTFLKGPVDLPLDSALELHAANPCLGNIFGDPFWRPFWRPFLESLFGVPTFCFWAGFEAKNKTKFIWAFSSAQVLKMTRTSHVSVNFLLCKT